MKTYRADVGECEGSSSQVGGPQLTRGPQGLEAVQLSGNLKHTEKLNVLHVGHQQTLAGVHSQADVVSRLHNNIHNHFIYLVESIATVDQVETHLK